MPRDDGETVCRQQLGDLPVGQLGEPPVGTVPAGQQVAQRCAVAVVLQHQQPGTGVRQYPGGERDRPVPYLVGDVEQ